MGYFELKDGHRLFYNDIGSGETVVMLHGWASSSDVFKRPAELLEGKARIITYDHRGHYGSKQAAVPNMTLQLLSEDLNELICGLGLENVTLLGWSMGAEAALSYIGKYGTRRLRQLVLCDMSPKLRNDGSWQLGMSLGQQYTNLSLENRSFEQLFDYFNDYLLKSKPELVSRGEGFIDQYIEQKRELCDWEALRCLALSLQEFDSREAVGRLNVPLTYFYAVPGSIFSPELDEWYRQQTKAPYKSVAFLNSTHDLIREHPEQFAREIELLLEP